MLSVLSSITREYWASLISLVRFLSMQGVIAGFINAVHFIRYMFISLSVDVDPMRWLCLAPFLVLSHLVFDELKPMFNSLMEEKGALARWARISHLQNLQNACDASPIWERISSLNVLSFFYSSTFYIFIFSPLTGVHSTVALSLWARRLASLGGNDKQETRTLPVNRLLLYGTGR